MKDKVLIDTLTKGDVFKKTVIACQFESVGAIMEESFKKVGIPCRPVECSVAGFVIDASHLYGIEFLGLTINGEEMLPEYKKLIDKAYKEIDWRLAEKDCGEDGYDFCLDLKQDEEKNSRRFMQYSVGIGKTDKSSYSFRLLDDEKAFLEAPYKQRNIVEDKKIRDDVQNACYEVNCTTTPKRKK